MHCDCVDSLHSAIELNPFVLEQSAGLGLKELMDRAGRKPSGFVQAELRTKSAIQKSFLLAKISDQLFVQFVIGMLLMIRVISDAFLHLFSLL